MDLLEIFREKSRNYLCRLIIIVDQNNNPSWKLTDAHLVFVVAKEIFE